MSRSSTLARPYLGWTVTVVIDRPLGSRHPRYGHLYPVNYGYLPGTLAPDGEALDAYVLSIDVPLETFTGQAVAIVHRNDDDDDKLVVVPEGVTLSDAQIVAAAAFQEQFFCSRVVR